MRFELGRGSEGNVRLRLEQGIRVFDEVEGRWDDEVARGADWEVVGSLFGEKFIGDVAVFWVSKNEEAYDEIWEDANPLTGGELEEGGSADGTSENKEIFDELGIWDVGARIEAAAEDVVELDGWVNS